LKSNRRPILLGLSAICILAVYFTDAWLLTCGFDGCPTPRDIQTFQPDQGGRILDRYNRVMGRLELVRRVNVDLRSVPIFVQQAFIATEDRRFFQHGGLDWRGFARALVTNPKLLIMDEPSEGLAPAIIENLIEVFRQLEAGGLRILLIEQNLGVATSLAKRQLIMVGGEIATETTADKLAGDADMQRRYLGVEPLAH